MPNDHLRTPLWESLPALADARAQDRQQIAPQVLPCEVVAVNGELVTVKFDVQSGFTLPNVTMPHLYNAYIRPPNVVGVKGMAISADYYIGGISQQGGGTANLYNRGNLTRLVFVPISMINFPVVPTRNLNAALITGPEGAVIQTDDGKYYINLNDSTITIHDDHGNEIGFLSDRIYVKTTTTVYLGGKGPGLDSFAYDFVMTQSGPSVNVKARYM